MGTADTVLVVEDDPEVRDAVAFLLRRKGYSVVATGDGAEAEALLPQIRPTLLVVDMMLPGRSGFQVVQAARALPGPRVPVVMMSANASAAHQDYALAAGVDAFLAKPFTTTALYIALARVSPPEPSVPGFEPAAAPAPARV